MAFGPDVSIGQAIPSGMASDLPILKGHQGLTGRQIVTRPTDLVSPDYDENGDPFFRDEPAPGVTIPPACLRVMNMPVRDGSTNCRIECPGRQPDGGCLCDLVREANKQGVEWSFSVSLDEYGNQIWTYNGPKMN